MTKIPLKNSSLQESKKRLFRESISSFSEVSLEGLDSHTLIVTDINDTLITSSHDLWQKETLSSLTGRAAKKLSKLDPYQKNLLANLMMHKSANKEIADSSIFFENLQKKEIPSLALTAAFSEPLDGFDMKDLVKNELKEKGIFFRGLIEGEKIFSQLKRDKRSDNYPTLTEEGILFTNGITNTKGEVLKAFLDLLPEKLKPKKILFFDDSTNNLDSVEGTVALLGVSLETYELKSTPSGIKKPLEKDHKIWESLIDRSMLESPRKKNKIKNLFSKKFLRRA